MLKEQPLILYRHAHWNQTEVTLFNSLSLPGLTYKNYESWFGYGSNIDPNPG